MRTLEHGQVIEGNGIAVIDRDGALVAPALNRQWSVPAQTVSAVPDLTDPATLGCLLQLVRESLGVPDLYVAPVEYIGPGPALAWRAWAVEGPDLHVYTTSGKTEAEALVAALEDAP